MRLRGAFEIVSDGQQTAVTVMMMMMMMMVEEKKEAIEVFLGWIYSILGVQ